MKKLLLTLLTALLLNSAWAGPEDDALKASARKDFATVLKIVRPPALKGEAWAQTWLADLYGEGRGVVQDYAQAAKWYRLAAQQGDVVAQSNMGAMYSNGRGVVQDYAEAVKWFRLGAQQGYAPAQYNLGVMYYDGQGVVQDYVKAHSWYNLAASKNLPEAVKNRDLIAKRITPQHIAEAQQLARDCLAQNFKGCD